MEFQFPLYVRTTVSSEPWAIMHAIINISAWSGKSYAHALLVPVKLTTFSTSRFWGYSSVLIEASMVFLSHCTQLCQAGNRCNMHTHDDAGVFDNQKASLSLICIQSVTPERCLFKYAFQTWEASIILLSCDTAPSSRFRADYRGTESSHRKTGSWPIWSN